MSENNNTPSYWHRINSIRREITAKIIETITTQNLTEVEIYDDSEDAENVTVIWYGRHEIFDTAVEKVKVVDGMLELEVMDSDGESSITLDDSDFALGNVYWLAAILDAVKEKLTPKSE